MRPAKIVFIGAGSLSFGIPTLRDLFTTPALKGSTLSLVDIEPQNLERMYRLALCMNRAAGMELRIEKHLERLDALPGADYVINSLAIERCELWKQDFLIPKKHGVRHCLGENGGPGGLFFSMRTIPVILDICRDMERLCPKAWFLNFSNPESRIVLAVGKYTKIKCIGLCHGIFMARHDVCQILGREESAVEVRAAGLNHFQWLLSIRDRATREDLYPALAEKERSYDPAFEAFVRKIYRAFGLWPTCSGDHLGEYLPYGYEAGEHGYDFDQDARDRVRMQADVRTAVAGETDVAAWLTKSGEKAVEVVHALHTGERCFIPSAIVYNGGAIDNLPRDLAVEIPVVVDGDGVHKEHIGRLPDAVAAMLSLQVGPQQMAVEAAVHGSREMALQALLCDPVIHSTDAAEKLLAELWEINKPYIRPCR